MNRSFEKTNAERAIEIKNKQVYISKEDSAASNSKESGLSAHKLSSSDESLIMTKTISQANLDSFFVPKLINKNGEIHKSSVKDSQSSVDASKHSAVTTANNTRDRSRFFNRVSIPSSLSAE